MNFSISELIVILLIAILVIKPEQLPEVAYTFGCFIQTIKKFIAKLKNEINSMVDAIDKAHERKREH